MRDLKDIISKYTAGDATLETTNAALEVVGANFHLDPRKNILSEEEKRATSVGYYPDQANGYGLLDTGTGTLDKVEIHSGKLVNCDCGTQYALVSIAGRTYHVQGNTLVQ